MEYAIHHMAFWGNPQPWIKDVLDRYLAEKDILPPPQLAVGSWMVASMCVGILFDLATNVKTKQFPEFYFNAVK